MDINTVQESMDKEILKELHLTLNYGTWDMIGYQTSDSGVTIHHTLKSKNGNQIEFSEKGDEYGQPVYSLTKFIAIMDGVPLHSKRQDHTLPIGSDDILISQRLKEVLHDIQLKQEFRQKVKRMKLNIDNIFERAAYDLYTNLERNIGILSNGNINVILTNLKENLYKLREEQS